MKVREGSLLERTRMNARRTALAAGLVCMVVAGVGAAIGWASARHLETCWDEHVDRSIALALSQHPLTGGERAIDPSQTRLPMYVNALAFAISGRDDLALSRGVSLVVGALTVLATGSLAAVLFGWGVGVLSSILLAFSAYFISFARISMTEGDVFFACLATAAMWGFARYLQQPSARRWMVAAILLGLALGAKVFAIVLFVVFGWIMLVRRRPATMACRPAASTSAAGAKAISALLLVGLLVMAGSTAAVFSRNVAIVGWVLLLGLWSCLLFLIWGRPAWPQDRWGEAMGMVVLALMSFCVLMPVHLTEPEIARDLLRRLARWDHQVPLAKWSDHLRLYAGITLIKLTPPLGVLSVAALVYGVMQGRRDKTWAACTLGIVAYVAYLCLLPLRQTFYLMGIYPLLMILTAAFIAAVGRWLGRWGPWPRRCWAVAVVVLLAHLGGRLYQAYPHYHLYGYDLVGNQWLGAESRGYRNLIQTPSDGVESSIRWCNTDRRVRPGSRVVSYLWEDKPGQMVDDLLPRQPGYVLIRRGLSADSDVIPPGPSITDADFVLLHINNFLGYGDRPPDPPPLDVLNSRFRVVYTVRRGPLEVAWAYGRRD
jgi:hypothetical protein